VAKYGLSLVRATSRVKGIICRQEDLIEGNVPSYCGCGLMGSLKSVLKKPLKPAVP
jgi:hypothetical protein